MRLDRFTLYGKALFLVALVVGMCTTAVADVPTAPSDMYYISSSIDNLGARSIDVYWIRDYSDTVNAEGFNLYQSVDGGAFAKVDPVYVYGSGWSGYARIPITTTGSYAYYATAYNAEGESVPSPQNSITIEGEWVWFTSARESDRTTAGVEYTTTFSAASSSGAEVRFSVLPGNDGWGGEQLATIDPVTGVFKTTPAQDGYYSFPITVSLESDPTVEQTLWFYLHAGEDDGGGWGEEPDVCAFIRGEVKDTEGNPVAAGYITAIPSNGSDYMYYSGTIENGRYEIPVPAGEFVLAYEDEAYYQYQFYPNTLDFFEAIPLTVQCNDETTANFTVEAWKDTSAYIIVSGKVTRASDGSGVESEVVFYVADSWGYDCLWATTDQDGNYEVELPVLLGPWQFSYVAMAIPFESDVYNEYFDGADGTLNPGEAVIIDQSRSDVNFSLSGMPEFFNSIEGFVSSTDEMPADATIFVYPSTFKGDLNTPYYSMTRTMFGEYSLHNLAPGEYIIVAVPLDSRLAPGYYAGAGREVSMDWEEAEIITIDSTTTALYLDIMLPVIEASGISVVDGTTNLEGTSGSMPLGGTLVYVLDEEDRIVGYGVSDKNGKYRVARLGTGAYRLYADKVGFLSGQGTVVFEKPGVRQTIDLTLSAMATTSVDDKGPDHVQFRTWPNPVQSQLMVRFTATGGAARIALSDVMGRELAVQSVEAIQGENTVRLDVNTLPAGFYTLTLKLGESVRTIPVTIAR